VRVLSVDLAHTSCASLGIVVLESARKGFAARALAARELGLPDPPSPAALAARLADVCAHLAITTVLLDGPQAWKRPDNGLAHSRVCERLLNTPGKTGLPGCAKPGGYLPFIGFSVTVFEELVSRGVALWSGRPAPRVVMESFPSSAWRQLGVAPLPAKSRSRAEHLEQATRALRRLFPLRVPDGLSHDELQALVSGVAGVAVARGSAGGYTAAGVEPSLLDGTWREGFIVNPSREALTARS
jgi:hypothetical protein